MAVPVLLREEVEEGALLCPMIDARRMEVYSAVYDRALHEVRGIQADVVDAETYREYLDRGPVCILLRKRGREVHGGDKPSQRTTHQGCRATGKMDVPYSRKTHSTREIRGRGIFCTILSEGLCSPSAQEIVIVL